MNTTGLAARVHVTGDGDNVTGEAGTHLLGELAARLGVTEGFPTVLSSTTERCSAYDQEVCWFRSR